MKDSVFLQKKEMCSGRGGYQVSVVKVLGSAVGRVKSDVGVK